MKRSTKIIISLSLIIAGIIFMFWYLIKNISELRNGVAFSIDYWLVLLAFFFYLFVYLIMVLGWLKQYHSINKGMPFKRALKIYAKSNLTKYIPGKIFLFLGRGYFAKSHGESFSSGSISVFFEYVIKILTGLILGAVYLPFSLFANYLNIFWLVVFVLVAFLILIFLPDLKLFKKLVAYAYRKITKKESYTIKVEKKKLLYSSFLYFISWHLWGLVVLLLYSSVGGSFNFALFALFTGALAFAWVIATVSIIMPAGVGIREGVFVLLTASYINVSLAAITILILRIITIITDILFAGIMGFISKKTTS